MNEENDIDLSEWELVSTKKMFSYSLGYVISGSFTTSSAILFYYFEVEIGLPVALLGIAFIIFAIWNMVNDPLAGYLTDRPFKWTQKWGMRFPWLLLGVIPAIIFSFLIWMSPDADPSNPWPAFWWFIIMTCIFDTFYSIYTTHLNAGYTNHFRSDAERRRSSAINNIMGAVLGLFLGFIGPLVIIYGKKETFILSALIFFFIRFVLLIFLIPGIRESDELKERFLRGFENNENKDIESYWKTMKKAFKRKNFTSTFFVYLMLSLAVTLYQASGIYFMKDVLRLPLYFSIYTALTGFLGFMLFIPFWVNRMNKYGAHKVMKASLIILTIAVTPILWITTLGEAMFFSFMGGIAIGAFTLSLGPVSADVYDECTITDGKHQEAMYEGIRTFFFRFALIFQAVIFTVVHLLTAYNPDPQAIQTPLATLGIRIHMGLIPALLNLTAFFILLKWYDLEGEKKLAIKKKLRELGL